MLLGAFEARFSHGLLVVSAPESVDAHEDWDASTEQIHAGADSLYVGVSQSASGLVKVMCIEGNDFRSELSCLFVGKLALPSSRLVLYDPDETICMTVPVEATSITVSIYGNDAFEPREIVIVVQAVDNHD
jgi:hypothetical protein